MFQGRADRIILQQFASVMDPIGELKKLSSIEKRLSGTVTAFDKNAGFAL